MIERFYLKDYLSFKEVELSLDTGLVVFTGPSGSGKSILISSILSSLGIETCDATLCESTTSWEFNGDEFGLECDDVNIFKHTKKEKSRYFINNQSVSKKAMGNVASTNLRHLSLKDFSDFENENLINMLDDRIYKKNKSISEIKTGAIEIIVTELIIENKSAPVPFVIGDPNVGEETRLKYRYLELRDPAMYEAFRLRSKAAIAARNILDSNGFLEVETPILTKSTPEGARDYLVPSRVHNGEFYALPQSPQLFKQLLMVGGFDRYFQIAKCFRDEDLRADRQPEFTQIDVEMSFCNQEDVIKVAEDLLEAMFKACDINVQGPFNRITYNDAMELYGSDKPDLRYDLKMVDVIDIFERCDNEIFTNIAKKPHVNRIKALKVPGADLVFSKREMKSFETFVRQFGAHGLGYFQMKEDGLKGPLIKFFSEEDIALLVERLGMEVGDVVFFGAGDKKTVWDYMGRFRNFIAEHEKMNLVDPDAYEFVWVVDFPMFEVEDGRVKALHHPFTQPKDTDKDDVEEIESIAYDIVLNGTELGGGSIRIHKEDVQNEVFKLLGIEEEEAQEKFGFLLDALKFGAPPHGGFAMGFDRMMMLISKKSSIRDVIAFPKTQKASCILAKAPSAVDNTQLRDLHIRLREQTKA